MVDRQNLGYFNLMKYRVDEKYATNPKVKIFLKAF